MRILFFYLLLLSPLQAFAIGEDITYGSLKTNLLLRAKEDLFTVEAYPEMVIMEKTPAINLKFTTHLQPRIKKGRFYRVYLFDSFDSPNIYEKKSNSVVFNLVLAELGKSLQPTGLQLNVGAKATMGSVVGNFELIEDVFTNNPTLRTGRAGVGDHIVNASEVKLNGQKIPAYRKFKIIKITKKYRKFTLSNNYTLHLQNVRTGKVYTLMASGRTDLPTWAHIVAKENRRVIDVGIGELHY